MEKLSQLMDGELDVEECRLHIRRMGEDVNLAESWGTYHLIRDVLRDEASTCPDLTARVFARLEQEPTVLAPRPSALTQMIRKTLPMAAAVAGVGIVGLLAWNIGGHQTAGIAQAPQQIAQVSAEKLQPAPAPQLQIAKADDEDDYLVWHQGYSPSTAMQGVAPYVRAAWSKDADSAR